MKSKVERQTVDLSGFPDLVVIYLGMRVNAWTGVKTLLGMCQYWRDFDTL